MPVLRKKMTNLRANVAAVVGPENGWRVPIDYAAPETLQSVPITPSCEYYTSLTVVLPAKFKSNSSDVDWESSDTEFSHLIKWNPSRCH
jgi:hypothetical protein